MKKAINITIGNLVFYIEDDAFTILDSYIESIKIYFATLPDSEDIVQDMESRIAEHFASQKGSKQDHIITKATVEHLISVMGNVSEFEDDNTADIEKKETIVTKKTPA